jgi:hypothetical protein
MPHLNIVIDDTSYANARTKADAHNVYSAILVSNYMYCELIINRYHENCKDGLGGKNICIYGKFHFLVIQIL